MSQPAKYAGTCANCGDEFPKGTQIEYDRNAEAGYKATHADCDAIHGILPHFDEFDQIDSESRARYDGSNSVSWVATFNSGAEMYQNRAGRCEDAPCCGCCS